MSDKTSITLNGQEIEVKVGTTIREAAESQGVHIPTFCHDDRLKPFASCFLCVVDVEKARGLVPACSTQVAPGMVIQTDNERVTKSRKMALDLLLSDHAGDCVAPCEATCPANIDIQGYIAHLANDDPDAAVRLIKERNPLPVVCGRICPHPCESQCRRDLVDEPVAINPLKRFASEHDLESGPFLQTAGADTGKRVAIVGGGPAGLSAAFYLRQMGHAVEIFEALPELGGMARYGIPRFRMPWDLMDKEIKAIIDLGVKVNHNQRLGTDFSIADLKAQGFGAVLLATGAHKPKPMWVDNEDADGCIGGVDFLREVVLGNITKVGKKVAVIGGGDTAMDCARVSRRLGADVTLLYRRTQAEMPALPIEQEETIEEGVDVRFLTAPTKVMLDQNGRANGMEVITMVLGEPDDSGRRRPVPVEGSEEVLEFDTIIPAIGQEPDMACIEGEADAPETTKWNTFVYDENNQATNVDGVFAAGDCAFGPDILIRAIAEGRRAAQAIDLYVAGSPVVLTKPYAHSRGRIEDLNSDDFSPRFEHKKRALESTHPADVRMANGGYNPINVGLDNVKAIAEATRCIECGCAARFDCDLRDYATDYDASDKTLAGEKRDYVPDIRHPLIRIEADKCITCASCVRICTEVREVSALAFIQRGFGTRIGPNFDDPLQDTGCDACGMCTDVCPTGAITPNTSKEAGPWTWLTKSSTCTACDRGCGINVHTNEGRVVKVQSINNDPVNGAVICAEGRFSYQLLANGVVAADIDQAKQTLAAAASKAVVVSPRLTVEQIYASAQLAKAEGASLNYLAGTAGEAAGNTKINGEANLALLQRLGATPLEGSDADCILSVGSGISRDQAGKASIIALATPGMAPEADQLLPLADPITIDGAILNRDGDLAVLRGSMQNPDDTAGLSTIAALSGSGEMADLEAVRSALAAEVSELAALANLGEGRLIGTDLAPELGGVAADGRELAFRSHMESIGLN